MLCYIWDISVQVGNAAYHNDMLYEELRRSIPQLAKLLFAAEEDKTKANAAGALSNLVRNANTLCGDIVSQGALQVCQLSIFSLVILYLFVYFICLHITGRFNGINWAANVPIKVSIAKIIFNANHSIAHLSFSVYISCRLC